ncbi:hypothetical protein MPH_09079 [Macrophomina phaseolina MS6]|uniref:NAD-dependent epimerase/dehydratase n=1 Tax=Macrophomina phaseolina (strain MS6) TaxID=1126212 RepID=K2SA67_MACPH|nr:hypothetical protein MPH_09079 [Macrophomina phaseolina MS6]
MKDFDETGLDGTPGVRPVTEADPPDPPAVTSERALHCDKILEHGDIFDAAVIRPPNLYGYSGSRYGYFFKKAEEAEKVGVLEFAADARSIFHSAHVDDCAEAYVALSQDQVRSQVRQQVFNIAGSRYETLGQIAGALVGEYGVSGGAKFQPKKKHVKKGLENFIAKFSEWVSSEKIRRITGWNDKTAIFHEKIHLYRQFYEAARAQGRMELEALEAMSKEWTGEEVA